LAGREANFVFVRAKRQRRINAAVAGVRTNTYKRRFYATFDADGTSPSGEIVVRAMPLAAAFIFAPGISFVVQLAHFP
jgi:hypothetical protein